MKLLLDTNIFIPLEPTAAQPDQIQTTAAAQLSKLASQTGAELWLHPAQRVDLAQDADHQRRQLRETLFHKYQVLEWHIPKPPTSNTNDWVDGLLIEALEHHAVTALVTEDRRLKQRASRAVGPDRVLTLSDAISFLSSLTELEVEPPPAVERVPAYILELQDSFWDSFREQYPDFDGWFRKCQREHRTAWIIRDPDGVGLVGATIINPERVETRGLKTLKICSFKVAPQHSGRRYGELLLKSVFQFAFENQYDSLLITVFRDHGQLIELLEVFGFEREDRIRESGEYVFTKHLGLDFGGNPGLDPLQFFVRHGPFTADLDKADAFIIPIRPNFHEMLFPELQTQQRLVPGREAYSNGMRKAYLSQSSITPPAPGSVLFFYRSEDEQSVSAWGVVEATLRSSDAEEVCAFVVPRTVYTTDEIFQKCAAGPVLAIIFRQGLRRLTSKARMHELRSAGVLAAAPQSILKLSPEAKQWMSQLF